MKCKLIIMLLLLSFLVSCIPSQELESLGIITARGVDRLENNELETTLVLFQFEAQSNNITKIIKGRGKTIRSSRDSANFESNFKVVPGKIQLEMYGKETAKQGILPYIDTLHRDASVPDAMYLAISNTTAKEVLSIQGSSISMNIGQYLRMLIEENARDHQFPRVTLQGYLSNFYDIGIDPILPIIDIHDDIPKLTGIAIFNEDKLVGEMPAKEITLFNLVNKKVKEKQLEVSFPFQPFEKYLEKEENIHKREDTLYTSYNIIKGKGKTKLIDKEKLLFQTTIDIDLNLLEISEKFIIKNKQVTKLLEKELEKELKHRYEKILAKLQELDSDSFGYGTIYRINKKDGKLSRTEWREKYPTIKVDFKINAHIVDHGSND